MAQHKTLTKTEAIEDVWSLKQTLEATHPNLYYSLSEEAFASELNAVINRFDETVNVDSLSNWLMPVVNKLNDGHTRIAKTYTTESDEAPYFFPLKLDLKNYTVAQANDYGISRGAQIDTINGMALHGVVERLLVMIDGEKDFNRLAELEYTFPYWLNRLYGQQKQFILKGTMDGKPFTSVIDGVNTSNFYTQYDGDIEASFNIYEHHGVDIAYLQLSLFGDSKDYFQFIDRTFEQLNQNHVSQLIIDIRDNPGGNTLLAEYIFQFLVDDSYRFYQSTTTKYSKLSRRMYRQYGWRKPYLLPIMVCTKPYWKTKGERVNTNHELFAYRKEEERYKGDVYLITSHYCYSTADDFARVFKYHNMGTIVGEETGGLKESYGDVLYFLLPNSQIECGCSYQHYSGLDLGDNPTDGVKPDVYVDGDNFICEEVIEFVAKQDELVLH